MCIVGIMYIHRGFFAQAISFDPQQPEHGKYSRSVLRTFEGACIIIRGMQNFVSSHAKLAARLWFRMCITIFSCPGLTSSMSVVWNHLLTAIVSRVLMPSTAFSYIFRSLSWHLFSSVLLNVHYLKLRPGSLI